MSTALHKVAARINELAKQETDTRLRLCRAVASAMDLVKEEGLNWRDWANQNLRKPDGSKWALGSLYKMAMFGRNPRKLANARRSINEYGQRSRALTRAVHAVAAAAPQQNAKEKLSPQRSIDFEKEFSWLMSAWKAASPPARKRFLDFVMQQMEKAS